jgi:hypothetical protein
MIDPAQVQAAPGGFGPPPGGYGAPPHGGGFIPPPGPGPGSPGGFGSPPGYDGAPGGGGPNEALRKDATTWLIVSGVSTFFCNGCCFSLIGAVMCFLAMQAADQGNTADAEAKLKWGKILTIVGVALGVLSVVAYVLYTFVWAAAAISSP